MKAEQSKAAAENFVKRILDAMREYVSASTATAEQKLGNRISSSDELIEDLDRRVEQLERARDGGR